MLDELLIGGEIQETSKKNVLKAIAAQDLLQEEETPQVNTYFIHFQLYGNSPINVSFLFNIKPVALFRVFSMTLVLGEVGRWRRLTLPAPLDYRHETCRRQTQLKQTPLPPQIRVPSHNHLTRA